LWRELDTRWLLLDCELLPWSAKADALIREQYAPVGAAARAGLPVALEAVRAGQRRGLDMGDLPERIAARVRNAEAFTAAYRRYCWPTDGLDGLQLAPFMLLASEGRSYADADHGWQLEL